MTEQSKNKLKGNETDLLGQQPHEGTQLWEPDVKNVDNDGLGALNMRGGRIGVVDEVNGPGATEVPGFLPTQHELLELVRYWAGIAIGIDWRWFVDECYGSEDIRLEPYAWKRISRIGDLLGEERVKKVVDEVYEEYGETHKKHWNVFLHGTEEERAAVRAEINKEFEDQHRNNKG